MWPWERFVSLEAVEAAIDVPVRSVRVWTKTLTANGFRPVDGQVPLNHAVAVAAAAHFRSFGVSRARVDRMFKELLRDPPDYVGWVLVDHRDRYPIDLELPPTSISLKYYDRKAPIVFDPAPFIERLGID